MEANGTRTYRFTITVTVEPDQAGYGDPEWIADAAWGALANEYGYDCTFGGIVDTGGIRPTPGPTVA